MIDRGDGNGMYQTEWLAGPPKVSRWMGTVKTSKVRRFAVTTHRCESCGYLASYATTPLNDIQAKKD